MDESRTVPVSVRVVPVRTLRAEVLSGPDAGRGLSSDNESFTVGTAEGNTLVVTDPTVSRFHIELSVAPSGVRVVDLGSTNGTRIHDVIVERAVVPAGSVLTLGRTTLRVGEGRDADVELHGSESVAGIHGRSASMRKLMAAITRAARSDASALITGESGTGKELVARALHEVSPRAGGPFETVDCGALTPTLVASELFGHERGAFTGADRQHTGAFERANGGTLFLDEIGELAPPLQAALLGVLERRKFRRVGGRSDIAVNVRVVSATHRDLRGEVNAGRFRLDLYYRLAIVTLRVPPLRERPEDIPVLVEYFLRECGLDTPVSSLISPATMQTLQAHAWPGNVRELRNLVEASVAMGEPPPIESAEHPDHGASDPIGARLGLRYKEARAAVLDEFEVRYLRALIGRAEGNVSRAARESGINRGHLTEMLQRRRIRG
jgi:DNA-binding NtrC family response regulator